MWQHRGKVAVVGVGHSPVLWTDDDDPAHHLGALAIDSSLKAIADAGLKPQDIDGIFAAPHQPFEGSGHEEGIDEVTSVYLVKSMKDKGLVNVKWTDDSGGMVGGALILAIEAVATGRCNYALVVRALHNPKGVRYGHGGANVEDEVGGPAQFTVPYGLAGPASFAVTFQRYLWKYNQPREKMATFAVNNRKNALMYEHGFWYQNRPEPLTQEDYLNARMICSPLNINDCDHPVQGSGSFIVTTAERARELKQSPVYILGHGLSRGRRGALVGRLEEQEEAAADLRQKLYEAAGIGPRDVDVANLYDGFLCITPIWTEQMGFCKPGEFLDFIQGGMIEIGGKFPLNTSSGNNGAGRMHGVPHCLDSVLQIQGRAGKRQVKDAHIALAVIGPHGGGQGIVFSKTPS